LNYYSSCKASELSFVELYNDLEKYIDEPKRRWKACVRVKRGLKDTSTIGGLYKDKVRITKAYLEGAVKLLKQRNKIDFEKLYVGKISVEDTAKPLILRFNTK